MSYQEVWDSELMLRPEQSNTFPQQPVYEILRVVCVQARVCMYVYVCIDVPPTF